VKPLENHQRLADIDSVRRVVLVKTSSLNFFRNALVAVRWMYPKADLYILSEERESSEFFSHPDVSGVILYLNIPTIPALIRHLRGLQPDRVVIQVTRETTYDKLKLLAIAVFPGNGLVLDAWGRPAARGDWRARLGLTLRDIASGWWLTRSATTLPRLLVCFARRFVAVGSFPFLVFWLLVGAARAELGRRAYCRRTKLQ
jgi:hypothetical protein